MARLVSLSGKQSGASLLAGTPGASRVAVRQLPVRSPDCRRGIAGRLADIFRKRPGGQPLGELDVALGPLAPRLSFDCRPRTSGCITCFDLVPRSGPRDRPRHRRLLWEQKIADFSGVVGSAQRAASRRVGLSPEAGALFVVSAPWRAEPEAGSGHPFVGRIVAAGGAGEANLGSVEPRRRLAGGRLFSPPRCGG